MNAYRIIDTAADEDAALIAFRHTLNDAKQVAQATANGSHPDVRGDLRVQLVDIKTDAKAVIEFLNGHPPKDPMILRTWKLTPRGGLVELDPTTDKPLENA